jgi:hypothetical protein
MPRKKIAPDAAHAFEELRRRYNVDAERIAAFKLPKQGGDPIHDFSEAWSRTREPLAPTLLRVSIEKTSKELRAAGIDPEDLVARLKEATAGTPQTRILSIDDTTPAERRMLMAQRSAEVQPVHQRLTELAKLPYDDAARGIRDLAAQLGDRLRTGTTLVSEMLLSEIFHRARSAPDAVERKNVLSAIEAVAERVGSEASEPAALMIAQGAVLAGAFKSAAASLARIPPAIQTTRSRALLGVASFESPDLAVREAAAERIRAAFVEDPLDAYVGLEAVRALRAVRRHAQAKAVAETALLESRRAFSRNAGTEVHRAVEIALSRLLGEPSRLERVPANAFAAADTFAMGRMEDVIRSLGLPLDALELGRGAGANVFADTATKTARALFNKTAAYRARGQVQTGNYGFDGIAHDIRFAGLVEKAFEALLEHGKLTTESDPEVVSHRIDVMIRDRFNTKQMEDLHSPFHKLFDQIFLLAKKELSIRGWSVTDPAADFLESFGDCRQHAAVKQMMFQAWQNHLIRGHLDAYRQAAERGDGHAMAVARTAIEKINRFHCRVMDAAFEPAAHPEKAEEHTFPLLIETAPCELGAPMGDVVSALAADAFYHRVYPLAALPLDVALDGDRLRFGAKNGEPSAYGAWSAEATGYSGTRRTALEVETSTGLMRGCPWADFGPEFVEDFSALTQRYQGVLSGQTPSLRPLLSATNGRKMLESANDIARDRVDLFFGTWLRLFRDQAIYLAGNVDSTPAHDEVRLDWIDEQAILSSRQIRNALRSCWLLRALLVGDQATFTEGQEKNGLSRATFERLRAAAASWVQKIGDGDLGESDVDLVPFHRDIAFDLVAARAVSCDLGKSPSIREMIRDALPPSDAARQAISTIPESAMKIALERFREVKPRALSETHILSHLNRLPVATRAIIETTMALPNLAQLNQPLESFPSMFRQIAAVLAADPEKGQQAVGLWLLESFVRIAGVAAARKDAEGYRNGSGTMTEDLVNRYLNLARVVEKMTPQTSTRDCEALFDEFLRASGVKPEAFGDPIRLLVAKAALTAQREDAEFSREFEARLRALPQATQRAIIANLLSPGVADLTIIPRQLPAIIRNLGATPEAAAAAMLAVAPLVERARRMLADPELARPSSTIPYQLDLMDLARLTQTVPPVSLETFVERASRAKIVDCGGVDGYVVLENGGGAP